eukprot:gene1732-3350_t
MIKAITLVSACACVTSFSISHGRSTTGTKALKMGFETEIGAQAPLVRFVSAVTVYVHTNSQQWL